MGTPQNRLDTSWPEKIISFSLARDYYTAQYSYSRLLVETYLFGIKTDLINIFSGKVGIKNPPEIRNYLP